MTEPEPLQQLDRTFVRYRGRKLSYFSGCDYFRLSSHPSVAAAFKRGADKYGINVAASRLTTGNHELYQKLEQELAGFFSVPDVLLTPTGYVANLVVGQALAGQFSHALVDSRAHSSLQDAAQMLRCPVFQFRHRDARDLEKCVRRCGVEARPILLTDGMFSHDGSVAPLREYLQLLPGNGLVLVDDAHGAAVVGTNGRGAPEHCGVNRRRIVQTITLSKAFGVYGGAILGTGSLRRRIFQASHLFVGSTPFPLPVASAVLESIALLRSGDGSARKRLMTNMARVRRPLQESGMMLPNHPGPIIAVTPTHAGEASRMKKLLLKAGVFPPFIMYPGGPPAGYFRFVISSEHTASQLDILWKTLLIAVNGG